MAVAISDTLRRWPTGTIKYNPKPEAPYLYTAEKLKEWVSKFNALVGYPIWVDSANEFDITFRFGSQSESDIGRIASAPKQYVSVRQNNEGKPGSIFHEMCHAIGLGHENYHTGFPGRNRLLQMVNQPNASDRVKRIVSGFALYMDIGPYNPKSIMLYGPSSFGLGGTDISYEVNKPKDPNADTLFLTDGDIAGIRFLMPYLRPQPGSLIYRKWHC